MQNLLPCPFCGGEAEFERTGTRGHSCIVQCTSCGALRESSDEYERSGSSWNDRAALAQPVPAADVPLQVQGSDHDNLRDRIGQAISDEIANGVPNPDWFDSREIDRIADAVIEVLPAAPQQREDKDAERYQYIATLADWSEIEAIFRSIPANCAAELKAGLDKHIDAAIAAAPKDKA